MLPPNSAFRRSLAAGREELQFTVGSFNRRLESSPPIGSDHYKNYRSLEATARAKGQLVELLPSTGMAILNADDPHVLAMASRTSARVVTFGTCSGCRRKSHRGLKRLARPARPDGHFTGKTLCGFGQSLLASTGRPRFSPRSRAASSVASISRTVRRLLRILSRCSVGIRCTLSPTAPCTSLITRHRSGQLRSAWPLSKLPALPARQWCLGRYRIIQAKQVTAIAGWLETPWRSRTGWCSSAHTAGHVSRLRQGEARERLFAFETSYQASAFLAHATVAGGTHLHQRIARSRPLRTHHAVAARSGGLLARAMRKAHACLDCGQYRIPDLPPPRLVHGPKDPLQ